MKSGDITGNEITGGYLLELDTYYDEVNKFRSGHRTTSDGNIGMPVNIKAPDEDILQTEQFNYIRDYFNIAEDLLYAKDFPTNQAYQNYIDLNTFVDWWFVYELTQNGEPNHPKSSYMYKDRGGKLKAGPVWDFDWGTFVPDLNAFCIKDAIWYNRLFQDPVFVALVKKKWSASKATFETVSHFIDKQETLIKESAEANNELWPITQTVNKDETMSFEDAVARLKAVYVARVKWLDKAINSL